MDTNKLASILAQSKKVMRRADNIQNNGNAGSEQTMTDVMSQAPPQVSPQMENYDMGNAPTNNMGQQPIKNTFANKDTTTMPREIVEAMINNPIETPTLNNTFEASADLIEAVRGADGVSRPQPKAQAQQTTTTNVDGIREIIREELEKVIDQYIDKRLLNEEIQVKVGNTVFSGNLRPLPKKKVRKK
tara:strand:+ start:427 stop:990 length:564 start_codon:yes stop_codon:yes gene_type:complete